MEFQHSSEHVRNNLGARGLPAPGDQSHSLCALACLITTKAGHARSQDRPWAPSLFESLGILRMKEIPKQTYKNNGIF